MLRFFSTRGVLPFVRSLPPRMLLPLGAAIFFLLAMMGFIVDVASGGTQPWPLLVTNTLASGLLGVGYGYGSMRTLKHRLAVGACHAAYILIVVDLFAGIRGPADPDAILARLRFDAGGIIVCMMMSYTFFLRFTATTGATYLATRAEIRLASEIHAVLVPPLRQTIGEYQFHGFSRASGDVGGDLVDLVVPGGSSDGEWIGYVADVSGHGVSSGVLMGMAKSAARMRLRAGSATSTLLDDLNDVLLDLKHPSMYVTCAGLRRDRQEGLEFWVAGHLPILHVSRDGRVAELTTPQLPLGVFPQQRFVSSRVMCRAGELLVILTDGLTEVFDSQDREFGLDRVKALIAARRDDALEDIAHGLIDEANNHGAQLDDQTLLLVRRR